MLMAFGPFRFTVPLYSVEELQRRVTSRVSNQDIIGARPTTHLLGPGEETVSFKSTFHPLHLNKGGLLMLEGLRAACNTQIPMMLVSLSGLVFGRWVITSLDDTKTMFSPMSVPQVVTVDMDITRYVPRGGGAPLGLF